MRRRDFIALGGAAIASGAGVTKAQALPLIGYLSGLSSSARPNLLSAFRQGLNVGGFIEGRNVRIEYRYANNDPGRLQALAADLITHRVNVIVATGGNLPGLAAKSLTSAIPIIFTSGVDPVDAGFVKSLGRPEGNVTGVSFFTTEIGPKHVELMRELLPRASRFAVLLNRRNPEAARYEEPVRKALSALRMSLLSLAGSSADEIDSSFAELAAKGTDALLMGADPFLTARASQIVALAARYGIPTMYGNREFTDVGGLMSYGNNLQEVYRRAGIYTARVLKGDKPADLPIDRATKFELVVNSKAARALGLEIPLPLQMRIDEVIE